MHCPLLVQDITQAPPWQISIRPHWLLLVQGPHVPDAVQTCPPVHCEVLVHPLTQAPPVQIFAPGH